MSLNRDYEISNLRFSWHHDLKFFLSIQLIATRGCAHQSVDNGVSCPELVEGVDPTPSQAEASLRTPVNPTVQKIAPAIVTQTFDLRLLSRGNLRSTRRGDPTLIHQPEDSPADGDDTGEYPPESFPAIASIIDADHA